MDATLEKKRDSNLELFRIITMLVIVAHHYVVNSGLMYCVQNDYPSLKSIFLLILGWGGKTGINCFVLITGYYMCKSQITLRKGLKLLFEILFYNTCVYLFFVIYGYTTFSIGSFFYSINPLKSISNSFISSYLIFFCLIPFLNILIHNLSKKQHLKLLLICLFFFSLLPNLFIEYRFNYVEWFVVLFFIGSYLRLYEPFAKFNSIKISLAFFASVIISWSSVYICSLWASYLKWPIHHSYFMVSDSNKPLAVITAVFAFLFFKNLKIKHNSCINTIAASAFGVLCIHANSDTMRSWLWYGVLRNIENYNGNIFLHALLSVLLVYVVCTILDFMRIRYIERPFFKFYDSFFKK